MAYKHLYFYLKVGISLSLISKQFETDFGNLSRAVSICHEPPKKFEDFLSLYVVGPSIFALTKECPKKFIGKFAIGLFLLSFEARWSN